MSSVSTATTAVLSRAPLSQSANSARHRALAFPAVVGLGSIAAGITIALLSSQSWFMVAVAAGLLFATTLAVLLLNARLTKDAFSPLALIAVYYLFAFGAGGIYYSVSPGPFALRYWPPDLAEALFLANIGWLLLLAGYLINPLKPVSHILPPFPRTPATASVLWTVAPLLLFGWVARAERIVANRYFVYSATSEVGPTGSNWFFTAAALFPTLATAYVGARSFREKDEAKRRSLRRAYWLMLAIEVLWNVPSGARANVVALALMAVVVAYYGRGRRLSWVSIAVVSTLLAFTLFPVVLVYRQNSGAYGRDTRSALAEAADKTLTKGVGGLLGSGATATFSRFSDVTSLALIASRERIPLNGRSTKTLQWIPETFVPRTILKTKEDPGFIGNIFGASYGLTEASLHGTSIAVSQVGELYVNFGLLGLLVGMPLVGGFYRLIGDYFNARKEDAGMLAVYAVAAWHLIHGQETIIALGVVGVIKLMIVFALMIIVTTRARRRWAGRSGPARLTGSAA